MRVVQFRQALVKFTFTWRFRFFFFFCFFSFFKFYLKFSILKWPVNPHSNVHGIQSRNLYKRRLEIKQEVFRSWMVSATHNVTAWILLLFVCLFAFLFSSFFFFNLLCFGHSYINAKRKESKMKSPPFLPAVPPWFPRFLDKHSERSMWTSPLTHRIFTFTSQDRHVFFFSFFFSFFFFNTS